MLFLVFFTSFILNFLITTNKLKNYCELYYSISIEFVVYFLMPKKMFIKRNKLIQIEIDL